MSDRIKSYEWPRLKPETCGRPHIQLNLIRRDQRLCIIYKIIIVVMLLFSLYSIFILI